MRLSCGIMLSTTSLLTGASRTENATNCGMICGEVGFTISLSFFELIFESITVVGDLNILESDLKFLNKSSNIEWVHTKPELGGGIQANIEVFHQLHCLVSSSYMT
jgi:hypothetical protein